MKLANKLGKSYDQIKEQVKIKSIEIAVGENKFTLRVRVPLKREMETLTEMISKPPEGRVKEIYEKLSRPILEAIKEGGEDFEKAVKDTITVMDTDILTNGTSVRHVAHLSAIWETKVECYFGLLQSETDEPVNETYAQIAEELPEEVIKTIVEEIELAIRPDYKTAKKN